MNFLFVSGSCEIFNVLQQIKGKDKIVMTRIFSCMTLKDLLRVCVCLSLKIYALITVVFIGLSTVLISKYYCRVS